MTLSASISKEFITVLAEFAQVRLDRFLRLHCPLITRSRIYAAIRQGDVRINGKRVLGATLLAVDDAVRLPPLLRHHWQDEPELVQRAPKQSLALSKPLPIIYEDEAIVAINKPVGVACHGGSGISSGVIEQMRRQLSSPKMELVHRLDRETSGVLLLSRSRLALRPLHQQFREGTIKKEYRAIVHGIWHKNTRNIKHPLYKFENENKVHKVIVSQKGKPSHTEVLLINHANVDVSPPAAFSYLRLLPHTGRTHQLRVHLAHEGHAIIGDARYADFEHDSELRKRLRLTKINANRMFLHAFQLKLVHPITGKPLLLAAPVPALFSKLLESVTYG